MYERLDDLPVWRIRFTEHPGLTVRVTVPTLEARALAPKLIPLLGSGRHDQVVAAIARMAGPFADSLLSWDLKWAGQPVPPTRRGVLRVDDGLIAEILQEWIRLWPKGRAKPTEQEQPDSQIDQQFADLPMEALVPDAEPEPEVEPELVSA